MAGVILLTTMAAGGVVLWRNRRREKLENSQINPNDDVENLK
jgi:hypothetical protein